MHIVNPTASPCFVYAIRLTYDPSQEVRYVGLSSRGDKRLKDHLRTYNRPNYKSYNKALYRWMRKHYGQITFEILEESSKEDLLLVEMKWIHIMRSLGHRLFNATEGGDGFSTYIPTPEHREKMAQNLPRYPSGPDHPCYGRENSGASNGMYGKTHDEDTRRKIGSAHKGKTLSDDHKQALSMAATGRVGRNKLDAQKVMEIRELRKSGAPISELSERFGVLPVSISRVVLRQTWKHV